MKLSYPNVSIINKTLYTFGTDKEVFIKFKTTNHGIELYDELAMLDINTFIHKISPTGFIVCLKSIGEKKYAEIYSSRGTQREIY